MSEMQEMIVTLGEGEAIFGAFADPTHRWNGWIMPHISEEDGKELVATLLSGIDTDIQKAPYLDEEGIHYDSGFGNGEPDWRLFPLEEITFDGMNFFPVFDLTDSGLCWEQVQEENV